MPKCPKHSPVGPNKIKALSLFRLPVAVPYTKANLRNPFPKWFFGAGKAEGDLCQGDRFLASFSPQQGTCSQNCWHRISHLGAWQPMNNHHLLSMNLQGDFDLERKKYLGNNNRAFVRWQTVPWARAGPAGDLDQEPCRVYGATEKRYMRHVVAPYPVWLCGPTQALLLACAPFPKLM